MADYIKCNMLPMIDDRKIKPLNDIGDPQVCLTCGKKKCDGAKTCYERAKKERDHNVKNQ